MNAPISSHRVLPTLNENGTRRWLRPRLFRGRFQRARLSVAWGLLVLFVALPFVRISAKPAVLLDVLHRRFTLFGTTFLPTDGVLLMLLLLTVFISIFLITAIAGRVWCGWACPQTVYMEFVFRPIERFFEGDHNAQMRLDQRGASRKRVLKFAVYLLISAIVGNVFLAYFVGVDALTAWVTQPPAKHPTAFLVMAITTGLVFADFAYFREQMCTIVCPYARLQSVLLDKQSLIVAYDSGRGEPRGRKGRTTGDCVDCNLCVVACPTGIDIRKGLQLECIACAQCADACDGVMNKLGRATRLIGYTSQLRLGGEPRGKLRTLLRPRVIAYAGVLAALLSALLLLGHQRSVADLVLLRGLGAPFVVQDGLVRNHLRIRAQNRSEQPLTLSVALTDAGGVSLVSANNPFSVPAGAQTTESLFVLVPPEHFQHGTYPVRLVISDGQGFARTLSYTLLGPEAGR
jgi:cytochrome c oxidase accessory protein FixG